MLVLTFLDLPASHRKKPGFDLSARRGKLLGTRTQSCRWWTVSPDELTDGNVARIVAYIVVIVALDSILQNTIIIFDPTNLVLTRR